MNDAAASPLLDAQGRPVVKRPVDRRCPSCKAGPERRVLSSGFGFPHDVCSQCGFEFEEATVERP